MDARSTISRAVTIRNGRFVTVGDAAPAATPGAQVEPDVEADETVAVVVATHLHLHLRRSRQSER